MPFIKGQTIYRYLTIYFAFFAFFPVNLMAKHPPMVFKDLNPGEVQKNGHYHIKGQPGSLAGETEQQYNKRMKWWTEARFGMFIHWGPVSLTGKQISWSRNAHRSGYHLQPADNPGIAYTTPKELYDNLYKYWYPDLFDANKWVDIAVEAGMKYMVLIVKHHDGFCLYDSKLTDYKSTGPEAKWKQDVLKQVADACHKSDIKLFVYYSLGDWYHPDSFTANHQDYLDYMHAQLREICTGYGEIAGIWFDLGAAYCSWDPQKRKIVPGPKKLTFDYTVWETEKMFAMLHRLQPGIILNNRARYCGDFATPEQKLGIFEMERRWETCVTLGKKWAWKPGDKIKSVSEVLALLQRSAGSDGNMLLNVGPMPDGRIEPRQVDVLKGVGSWMKLHGQSIYGTRGGPYKPNRKLASTRKDNFIYLHLLTNDNDILELPSLPAKVLEAKVMGSNTVAKVTQSAAAFKVFVPENSRQKPNTVIMLKLDGPAINILPIPTTGSELEPENLR